MKKAKKGKTKMTEELLQKLTDLVTNTAPYLWEIGVRQSLVTGIRYTVVGTLLLVLVIWSVIKFKHFYNLGQPKPDEGGYVSRYRNDDYDNHLIILGSIVLVGTFFMLIGLNEGIARLVNPGYYAILDLIQLVK